MESPWVGIKSQGMAIPCQGSWQLCSLPIKHFRAPSLCCIKCTITTLCVVHSVVQSYTIPNIELKFKGSILFKLPLMCSVDQLNTILNKKIFDTRHTTVPGIFALDTFNT